MTDKEPQEKLSSKFHRFEVGDVVQYQDETEWPPVTLEGTITGFANDVRSYLVIDFDKVGEKTLTEDEVKRVA